MKEVTLTSGRSESSFYNLTQSEKIKNLHDVDNDSDCMSYVALKAEIVTKNTVQMQSRFFSPV